MDMSLKKKTFSIKLRTISDLKAAIQQMSFSVSTQTSHPCSGIISLDLDTSFHKLENIENISS